jgi:hypothetical protein
MHISNWDTALVKPLNSFRVNGDYICHPTKIEFPCVPCQLGIVRNIAILVTEVHSLGRVSEHILLNVRHRKLPMWNVFVQMGTGTVASKERLSPRNHLNLAGLV